MYHVQLVEHPLTITKVVVFSHDGPRTATITQVVVNVGSLIIVQCLRVVFVVVAKRCHLNEPVRLERVVYG